MTWIGLASTLFCGLAGFTLLGAGPSARAAEQHLTADVEVLFPIEGAKLRGGGVSALAPATMERLDAPASPDGKAMLRLASGKAPVQGAWWFPGHLPLTPEQAMIGNRDARIVLEITSANPVKANVSVSWRVDGESGEWVGSGATEFSAEQVKRVELPIPPLKEGAKLTGLTMGFDQPGIYQIRRLSIARKSAVMVDPIENGVLRLAKEVKITGRAAAGVDQVVLRFRPEKGEGQAVEKAVAVTDKQFGLSVSQQDLTAGLAYAVTVEPQGRPAEASPAQRLFVFPALTGKQCPPVTRQGADLIREGKRFGFIGVNYTQFYLGLSLRANYEAIAEDLLQMKGWGIRVVRVPIDFGMIQPALGVMPDNPQYKELMAKHGMDPAYVEQLDYFVALAGELGIYTILDWHGMAVDPYRYFLGGNENQRKEGKPGTAVAYLAPSNRERGEFDLSNPKHVEALMNAHRWAAKHYRGNPNLLGAEIPYNEPHTKYMAIEANWRRITDLAAAAVAEGDPDRLTFWLQPSYSHNNLMPSATWLKPDRSSGGAPHFYQANGPVPTRPDAKSMKEPWLARESEGTFGWSFPAVMMPLSAVDFPVYNGETGAHGAQMVLPDLTPIEATSLLIEAQIFQEYATGMVGRLEWTLWRNEGVFEPYKDVYSQLFNRYAPVFEAGPIDRHNAEVAFVQHPEASPSSNGHNFGCIPFAKASLDLHLGHVHYLTDDQFRYIAAAELSVGLEQVVEAAQTLKYKAVIADRRHLDPRTVSMLKRMELPVLWLDRSEDLTADQLAAFLEKAGVAVDGKTPRELQIAVGPEHLVIYRRLDGGVNPAKAFPIIRHTGSFQLIDENGKTVFRGDAEALAKQGIDIDLPLWRSTIYRIAKP